MPVTCARSPTTIETMLVIGATVVTICSLPSDSSAVPASHPAATMVATIPMAKTLRARIASS